MSDQTPDDPPPYVMGPGPDYDPPPLEALIDPAVRDETATKGAALGAGGGRRGEGRREVDTNDTCERRN